MNIFIDATGITPIPTGLGNYSIRLLQALIACTDHRYTVLCSSKLSNFHELFAFPSERVIYIRKKIPVIGPLRDWEYIWQGKAISKCDLYHCMSSYLPLFRIQRPSIVTLHDLKYLKYPEFINSKYKYWYLQKAFKSTTKNASFIIAISEATKRDLLDLGVDSSRVRVVHEASFIKSAPSPDRDSLNLYEDYFLFIGENRPHKNLHRLINAYGILNQECAINLPKLLIAGNGSNNLNEYIAEKGLSNKIITLGIVKDEELVYLYKNAFALVFPSLYEGFGLPILEAMSLGVPVITSNLSSMREVGGNAVELVDPHSELDIKRGMRNLLDNSLYRLQLIKDGKNRALSFSWERAAVQTAKIYSEIYIKG
jgi:glycosyltransferase involved in cell wall biosynthesis